MDNFDDKYKKRNPFTVPEGYFEELTERVVEQVREAETPKRVKVIQMFKPYLGMAAIFVLALFVVQIVLPLAIDDNKMIVQEGRAITPPAESEEKEGEELHFAFQPTSDEIIEYLAAESTDYDLLYASAYN